MIKEKYLKALELDKVLDMLAQETCCPAARDLALSIRPETDLDEVLRSLKRTDDAFSLTLRFGTPSFITLTDPTPRLKVAMAGGTLSPRDLLNVGAVLRQSRSLCQWARQFDDEETAVSEDLNALYQNNTLEREISSAFINEEEIDDNASPELSSIRRKIRQTELKARDRMEKLIHSSTYQKYLQDSLITMRDGRFVVPVKAEYRGEIEGLVHDTSASGSTYFIEPMSVVEANNEIRVLQAKEKDEIERILADFSARCADCGEDLQLLFGRLMDLNVLFAKTRLASRMNAFCPAVAEDGKIDLKKARHPLIDPKKVVPIDVHLGDTFTSLVITGPNTGGKTVTLKTLGLLTLMTMCGLLIPAGPGSKVSTFENVLVDIGDEQSIEQSLSTFSAHMTNIVSILEEADYRSLVLVDELGSGTDPVEGAALATAILERFRQRHCRVAATTHYAELKIYALETPGVVNASCEFDVESLAPTYKLSVGVPGKSNAFLISAKLGIPESVIDAARNHMSNDDKRLDSVLAQLDDLKLQLKAAEDEAEKARYEAEHALESAEKKRDALIKQGEEELEATRRKAHELMQGVQNQAYALTDELRRIQKDEKTNAAARAVRAREIARKDTEQLLNRTEKKQPKRQFVPLKEVKPGQEVVIAELDQHAVVLSRPDKNGMVEVRAGILKTKVPLTGLCAPDKMDKRTQKQEPPRTRTRVELNHDRKSSMELNLLGYTVEEALAEVDRFLDHAMLSNQNTVYIIHGNGTGALRNAIQKHLRTHRGVKSFRLGRYGEGESGVTVVELK